MANSILTKLDARSAFTITVDSLAAGSARQSTLIDNTSLNRPGAIVTVCLESGTAPTAGKTYDIYLIRKDGTSATDSAGASDAAITIVNAQLLGSIVVTASANSNFIAEFDTAPLGPLGGTWGIAVKNSTDQSLHAATSTSVVSYQTYYPEVQ